MSLWYTPSNKEDEDEEDDGEANGKGEEAFLGPGGDHRASK